MKTIYKYILSETQDNNIRMFSNAEILTLQMQNGLPHIWALVDTDKPIIERIIHVYGTGQRMADSTAKNEYIGTWQEGKFVWHAFDYGEHPI